MSGVDIGAALRQVGFTVDGAPRRGATATVFRAHRDGQTLAVKVLDDTTSTERFEREAAILASIDHPNVAPLLDFGTLANGQAYLVTPWVEGETLADRLTAHGPLDAAGVRRLLVQLGDALDHIHQRGVVHRDLSLANVLIDGDNRITLIDFGVARAEDAATVTATSDLIGTTRYLAPELLEGAEPTPASDQYAASVIAYELAAGVWPFELSESVHATFNHHLSSAPIPLRERIAAAPQPLEEALERALSKDPADRFTTATDLANVALGASPTDQPEGRRWGSIMILVGGLATTIAAIAALVALQSGGDDSGGDESSASPEPQSAPTTTWPEGLASELDCNLLEAPGFESNALPPNFWIDPNDLDRERLVAESGVDGSSAVAIGRDDEFGAFGSIVDIRPNAEYVFAASVAFTERPAVAEISVAWLDANFDLIDGESVSADLIPMAPGRAVLEVPAGPPAAAYAVTRLYKDASGGVLTADELVFAERDSACDELLGLDG